LPFHYLDDFFQGHKIGGTVGLKRTFRFFNRLNGGFQLQTLFQQQPSLQPESRCQIQVAPVEQVLDLPEWQADELERDDLLQPRKVAFAI
jgi:hypothetical protein